MGIGVGLASVAGLRTFLPFAIVAVCSLLGFFALPGAVETFVEWPVIGGLLGLAVLESILDKVKAAERGLNVALVPFRAASGGVLFSAVMGTGASAEAVPGSSRADSSPVSSLSSRYFCGLRRSRGLRRFCGVPEHRGGHGGSCGRCRGYLDTVCAAISGGVPAILLLQDPEAPGRKYGGLRILGD